MTRLSLFVAAGTLALAAAARPATAQTAAPAPIPSTEAAAAPAPQAEPRQEARRQPRRRRDVITAQELTESGASDLLTAVQRLRPEWLRAGGGRSLGNGSTTEIYVYQNNTQLGGLDALRQLDIGFATELRYLDGSTASNTLPGLGSRIISGAIVVRTGGRN